MPSLVELLTKALYDITDERAPLPGFPHPPWESLPDEERADKITAMQAAFNSIPAKLEEGERLLASLRQASAMLAAVQPGDLPAFMERMAKAPPIFLKAPRIHQGLGPDEFPAILERGDRVKPRKPPT